MATKHDKVNKVSHFSFYFLISNGSSVLKRESKTTRLVKSSYVPLHLNFVPYGTTDSSEKRQTKNKICPESKMSKIYE